MYRRLEAELVYFGITKQELAEKIGMRYDTLCAKLRGDSAMTFEESVKIKRAIGSDYPLEELFGELIEK